MNVLISGSLRKANCHQLLYDLKEPNDFVLDLSTNNVKTCLGGLGCNIVCHENKNSVCQIKDDLTNFYPHLEKADQIIMILPICQNFINWASKNIIDRLNHYFNFDLLKGKKINLITIGCLSEEENKNTVNLIKKYFESISDILGCKFNYICNLTSKIDDDLKSNYNYTELISSIKNKIK